MSALGILTVVFAVTGLVIWLARKYSRVKRLIDEIQGPTALPLIGNLHQFRFRPDVFFEQAQGVAYMFNEQPERLARIWFGPLPFILVYGAEECEAVLGSSKMLHKLFHYQFLSPWIGDGLLISAPKKWRPRRKLLTPTFHYDILKDFIQVFNKHSKTLCSKFDKLVDGDEYVDVFHTITLCTLDIICESALGVEIDAQNRKTPYLDAVMRMKYLIHQRLLKPHFYLDFVFDLLGDGRAQKNYVKILHNFTKKAIVERRRRAESVGGISKLVELQQKQAEAGEEAGRSGTGHSRMALLDLMLDMQDKGELDVSGVQEEVDTFTFEGHDTTSTALNWFLHLMGVHPSVQARVQHEIDDVLGKDLSRDVAFDDLGNLRYLDACLKETLRLYPSVPLIARQVTEEVKIRQFTVPRGTGVVVVASMVHRDPRFWPNPELFDPERFFGDYLKHPYCYIPFSAGSRNCIGQRFAVMEEKCLVANILRRFHVSSMLRTDEMRVDADLIIRPMYGNKLRFKRRSYGEYCTPKIFADAPPRPMAPASGTSDDGFDRAVGKKSLLGLS